MCASSLNKPSSQEGLKLVERLRTKHIYAHCEIDAQREEAATLISELQAERDQLKLERGTAIREGLLIGNAAAEKIAELKSALSRIQSETVEAWQPIETAPKDGTKILAYTWQEKDDYSDEAFGAVQIISWDAGNDHLDRMWARAAGWDQQLIGSPTHWQPLPTPPRSLKLPDYRGGEAKTAESGHSPSTLNAETE